MDNPFIAFHLGDETVIRCTDSCSNLRDHDLNLALRQCQQFQATLNQEIMKRGTTMGTEQNEVSGVHYERLRKTVESLKILERLDTRASKHVQVARESLESPQANRGFRVYREFLQDIMRHCGPEMVLLSAVSFGKQKIASMTLGDRTSLVRDIRAAGDTLLVPVLSRLAQEYGICHEAGSHLATHQRPHVDEVEDRPMSTPQSGPEYQEVERVRTVRRIEYTYSQAPIDAISTLGDPFVDAVRSSHQWIWERELAGTTTDCLTALVPDNRSYDISINMLVGWEKGTQLIESLELMPKKIAQ